MLLQAKDKTELDGRSISLDPTPRPSPAVAGKNVAAVTSSKLAGLNAWALQVFNLAYGATEQDLVDMFASSPVRAHAWSY